MKQRIRKKIRKPEASAKPDGYVHFVPVRQELKKDYWKGFWSLGNNGQPAHSFDFEQSIGE